MSHAQTLSLVAAMLLSACATVPDEAPAELHQAARAVHAAELAGADTVVPHSFKLATTELKNAVRLYSDKQPKEALHAAQQSEELATRAMHLAEDVRTWDGGDLLSYDAFRRAEADLAQTRAAKASPADAPVPASPLAIAQPVAFFDTASTEVVDASQPALNELVHALKDDAGLRVRLVGYADPRGDDRYNDKLARARVVAVATYLTDQGIDANRIRILSRGEKAAAAGDVDLGHLQLDRRVDAQLDATVVTGSVAH